MRMLLRRVVTLALMLLSWPAAVQAQFAFVTNNGEITITGYTGPGGAVVIPDTTNGLPVTRIGEWSFSHCNGVTDVTTGNSVVDIANWAFNGCIGLTHVTIGNSVVRIGNYAFYVCSSLANITIPDSVTNIGGVAFNGCFALTNVTIGNRVTSIGDYAFFYCTNLTEVYFRGDAPSLGGSLVFAGDNNAIVYYLPGTTGWEQWVSPPPAVLWKQRTENPGVRTNQFGFNISWARGMAVAVDACTNFTSPVWTPMQTNILTGDTLYFSDSQWTNHPNRFYRVRWP